MDLMRESFTTMLIELPIVSVFESRFLYRSRHACKYFGRVDEIHPRFPKAHLEIMKIHAFSVNVDGFCMKIHDLL